MIEGKKTYIIAAVMGIVALVSYFIGPIPGLELTGGEAMNLFLEGMGIAGIRRGVSTK